jgi:tRNA C32,U32 (ribose-2'-O)-methylase TrmJ
MGRSLVARTEALKKLLDRIPALVDTLGAKHPKAPEAFMQWLKDAEQCLQDLNAAQASELAAMRSTLYAKQYGDTTRKARQQACCEVLPLAQAVVFALYEKASAPIEEARKLLAPLLSAMAQTRAVPYASGDDFQYFIERLSHLLNEHEQLKASMAHVNALLPKHDCLWLLGDMVDLQEWPRAA